MRTINRTMVPSFWGGPTHDSLKTAITSIRAKLGEPKGRPQKLISIFDLKPNGARGKLLGYMWR